MKEAELVRRTGPSLSHASRGSVYDFKSSHCLLILLAVFTV